MNRSRDRGGEIGQREDTVGVVAGDRLGRHAREERVIRRLDDDAAAPAADRARACHAVVPRAGEDDRDRPSPVCERRAAEQHVDRRSEAVLVRASHHHGVSTPDDQVTVRRRDVDTSTRERLAVARLDRGQRAGARDDLRQPALRIRGQVKDDAHGCVEILGQSARECRQRLDASRGRAHDDHRRRRLVHPCVVSGGGRAKRRVGFGMYGKVHCVGSSDAAASVGFVAGAVGLIALLAVFVFWGGDNSTDALPYFAVPGVLFALSAALGYRVWQISDRRG